MKRLTLTFTLLSYWHAGTGAGRGGDADAVVQRDDDGLPYLPGKSVKGLIRDAVETYAAFQGGDVGEWFGARTEEGSNDAAKGVLSVRTDRALNGALVRVQLRSGVRWRTVAQGRVSGRRIPVALAFASPGRYLVRIRITEAGRAPVGTVAAVVVRAG